MKNTIVFVFMLTSLFARAQKEKAEAYVNRYKELAIAEMIRTGVPAAIKLAQGILESQYGESELARVSNNHFGIKCKTEWTGAKTYHDDDEKGECFRVYPTAADSYRDHSDFLKSRPHYAFLFKLDPTDFEGWANGLKKAGYATSPSYPQKLLKVINDYNLQQYSLEAIARLQQPAAPVSGMQTQVEVASGEPLAEKVKDNNHKAVTVLTPAAVNTEMQDRERTAKEEVKPAAAEIAATSALHKPITYPSGIFTINHTKVIHAQEGISLLSLASQYDIPLGKLLEYNELEPMDILDKDRLLFIERKSRKGASDFHVVENGESLYGISQQEGVRLDSLMEYNHLSKDPLLKAGDRIVLRTAIAPAKNANKTSR